MDDESLISSVLGLKLNPRNDITELLFLLHYFITYFILFFFDLIHQLH